MFLEEEEQLGMELFPALDHLAYSCERQELDALSSIRGWGERAFREGGEGCEELFNGERAVQALVEICGGKREGERCSGLLLQLPGSCLEAGLPGKDMAARGGAPVERAEGNPPPPKLEGEFTFLVGNGHMDDPVGKGFPVDLVPRRFAYHVVLPINNVQDFHTGYGCGGL